MGTTALMIRAESATEMVQLIQLDRLMSLATAIADDTARSDVECFSGIRFTDTAAWYDLNTAAEGCEPEDLERARRAWEYIKARGTDAFPWEVVTDQDTGLIRFKDKVPSEEVVEVGEEVANG